MRLLLTLPAALAFAGGFFRCFLKGPGRYFPQFELEITSHWTELTLGLLFGAITALMSFFPYPGKKTVFGDVLFQVSRSWTAILAKMRLAACG